MSNQYTDNIPNFRFGQTFNPIPMEFLERQALMRDNAYKQSEAGMLQAIDAYNQLNVGELESQGKQDRINEMKSNFQDIINKNKGDLGLSSSEIGRVIVDAGGDDFWRKAPEWKKARQEESLKQQKLGPNAIIWDEDWRNKTMEENNGIYSSPDFSGVSEERINVRPIQEQYFNNLTASGYQNADGSSYTGISKTTIEDQAKRSFPEYQQTSAYDQQKRLLERQNPNSSQSDIENQLYNDFVGAGMEKFKSFNKQAPEMSELDKLKYANERRKYLKDSNSIPQMNFDASKNYTLLGGGEEKDLGKMTGVETDKFFGNIGTNLAKWWNAAKKGTGEEKHIKDFISWKDLSKTNLEKKETPEYNAIIDKAKAYYGISGELDTDKSYELGQKYITQFYGKKRNYATYNIEYPSNSEGYREQKAEDDKFHNNTDKDELTYYDPDNMLGKKLSWNEDIAPLIHNDNFTYSITSKVGPNNPVVETGRILTISNSNEEVVKRFIVGGTVSERNKLKFEHTVHSINFNLYGEINNKQVNVNGTPGILTMTKQDYDNSNGQNKPDDIDTNFKFIDEGYTIELKYINAPSTSRVIRGLKDLGDIYNDQLYPMMIKKGLDKHTYTDDNIEIIITKNK